MRREVGARLKAGLGFRVVYDLKFLREGFRVLACLVFRFWCSALGCRAANVLEFACKVCFIS